MTDFEKKVLDVVQSCDVLIYAPPAYGKTRFLLKNRHHDLFCDYYDTDRLKNESHAPNHWFGIVTNIPALIPNADLSIAFLPSEEQFRSGCEFRNLDYQPSWYDEAVKMCRLATYVITTGDTLSFYARFIEKAVNHYFDGEGPIAVPTFKDGYKKDPAYPPAAVSSPPAVEEGRSQVTLHACIGSDCEPVELHRRSSDIATEIKALSVPAAPSIIETWDTAPTPECEEASKIFTSKMNVFLLPYDFELDGIPATYFGGNLIRFGNIYISVNLLLCKEHRTMEKLKFWKKWVPPSTGDGSLDSSIPFDPGPSSPYE